MVHAVVDEAEQPPPPGGFFRRIRHAMGAMKNWMFGMKPDHDEDIMWRGKAGWEWARGGARDGPSSMDDISEQDRVAINQGEEMQGWLAGEMEVREKGEPRDDQLQVGGLFVVGRALSRDDQRCRQVQPARFWVKGPFTQDDELCR